MTIRPAAWTARPRSTRAAQGLDHAGQRRAEPRLRIHRDRGPPRPSQVLAFVHGLGRQGRREGRLDRLEHLQAHLPRHDRQRASVSIPTTTARTPRRSAGCAVSPTSTASPSSPRSPSSRTTIPLPGSEQARPAGAAQRERVARGHERRGRAAELLAATLGQRLHAAGGEARVGPAACGSRAAGRCGGWQRLRLRPGQDAGGGQPAKPAGPHG